jgi:hypothetical protein
LELVALVSLQLLETAAVHQSMEWSWLVVDMALATTVSTYLMVALVLAQQLLLVQLQHHPIRAHQEAVQGLQVTQVGVMPQAFHQVAVLVLLHQQEL